MNPVAISSLRRFLLLVLLASGLALPACTRDGTDSSGSPESGGTAKVDKSALKPSSEPDAFVKATIHAMEHGRPDVVWKSIPKSYQADVTALVHDFGKKMDKEIWERSFGILDKLVEVLEKRKQFILEHPGLQNPMLPVDGLKSSWDSAVKFLDMIAKSDMKTLEGVKGLDVEKFLSSAGTTMTQLSKAAAEVWPQGQGENPLETLKNTKTSVVNVDGDNATVRIEEPGQPAEDQPFVKVEGVWIPKEMADDWPNMMAEARAGLEQMVLTPEQKAQFNGFAGMIEVTLDQLIAAENQEQFNQVLGGIMAMMGMGGPGGPGGPPMPGK